MYTYLKHFMQYVYFVQETQTFLNNEILKLTILIYFQHKKFLIQLQKKNSWMRDPRYKHEYLNKSKSWITVTGEGEGNDESDKHL